VNRCALGEAAVQLGDLAESLMDGPLAFQRRVFSIADYSTNLKGA
jgi:hypothetical protein